MAATLREHGHTVDLYPMPAVQTLEGYQAVVLGAPLYIGRWHKDAQHFLAQHRDALTQRPVAIFTLGPIQTDQQEWDDVRTQLAQEMAKMPWLQPVASELFGGRYEPATLRFPDNVLAWLPASPLHELPANDARDWDAIRAWANGLAVKLEAALSQ